MAFDPRLLLALLFSGLAVASVFTWFSFAGAWLRGERPAEPEPRRPVPWSGFDVLVVLFLFIASDAISQRAFASGDEKGPTFSLSLVAISVVVRLAWAAVALGYLSLRSGATARDLGLDFSRLGADLRFAVGLFLAAILPVYGLQLVFTQLFGIPSEHPLLKLVETNRSVGVLLAISALAAVAAPLAEEFLFRVVLQGWLERRQSLAWAEDDDAGEPPPPGLAPLVVVAVLFGLMHFGHGPDPIALAVLGLFLGYAYRQTHRVVPSLAIHVLVNSLAVIELWFMAFSKA